MVKQAVEYVPLWCKSNYSFLAAASHPSELVKQAKKLALKAIAISDLDGVYGIVRAHVAAKEAGIKLIIGSQVSLDDGTFLLLLVKDKTGYSNLCSLLSLGHLRAPKAQSKVSLEEVCSHAQGLIVLWFEQGQCSQQTLAKLASLQQSFEPDLYLGIARHKLASDVKTERLSRDYAAKLGISMLAAPEVLYHLSERQRLHDVLTCIKHTCTLNDAGKRLRANNSYALLSANECAELYRDDPKLIETSVQIAQQCQFSLDEIAYRYPDETVPTGFNTATWLRKATIDGAHVRYGETIPDAVMRQIDRELSIIEQLSYCGYFLTMWELVNFCRQESILCQGRGSAANSAVCFCLGVTAIDPVQMDLLFERFLSLERAEPPDIDLDIEHHRREEVIQHMYTRYGRDRAAMVANLVRYRRRSAIREVGKVFGISEVTLDRTAKLMHHWEGDYAALLKEAGFDMQSAANQLLLEIAQQITGFPRHLSIHPGGFLLGSEAVSSIVPIENASMSGRTVIQWDKEDIEALKLFKVDLLGLGALSHLDYCFKLLKKHNGLDLSMANIPIDDPQTYAMLHRADSLGVFQIESRAQMAMLPRLKPVRYYDLVIEISLVRPGPISGGMVHPYLARRAGKEAVEYPHPSLEPVLRKTLGVPLFQEQVMKLAVVAADYSPGEADQLRRDMAAWKSSGRIEEHREKLISRMIAKGIQKEFAERVFDQIRGFGEYGFPESHAASFALIAYATAYLKCHHPAVFACGLLNAWPMGFYAPSSILDDAKRHGVGLLALCVKTSEWNCILENANGQSVAQHANQSTLSIRVGFKFLKGFGKNEWQNILSQRNQQNFSSLSDFTSRCQLRRDSYQLLAQSGALECFGVSRRTSLWTVLAEGAAGLSRQAQLNDLDESAYLIDYQEANPLLKELKNSELIIWDFESTEQSVRGHVLEPYRSKLAVQGFPDASGVSAAKNGSRLSYIGYAICRQMPGTAAGVLFITLEDESGFVNLVVWEQVFLQFRTMILTNAILGVTGKLQKEEGVVHLVAEAFWVPDFFVELAELKGSSHDFH